MIVWPEEPNQIGYDVHGFRKNLQSLIIKKLKSSNNKDDEKAEKWKPLITKWQKRQQLKITQNELKNLIREGIPDDLRHEVWPRLCRGFLSKYPDYHNLLQEANFKLSQTILLDLNRTFPDNINFTQGSLLYKSLNNLLNVLSVTFPDMGYCQGLNFICAVTVLKLKEEAEAYKFLCRILGERGHSEMLADLASVKLNLYVFQRLLQQQFKVTSRVIRQKDVQAIQYASSWFITLYCGNLPFEYCMRILECYISQGVKVLYRVAIAIVKYKKKKVKQSRQFEDVLMTLKKCDEFDEIDPDEFFETVFKINITTEQIQKLTKEYRQSVSM